MAQEKPASGTDKDKEIDLLELLRNVWAARRQVVKYAVIGACIGLVIGFSIPKTYVTAIKLAPESKAGGSASGGMAGLAAMAGINLNQNAGTDGITLAIFPDIVKSTPFLLEFADIPVTLTPKKRDVPPVWMTLFEYVTDHQKKAWWKYVTAFPGKAVGWVLSLGRNAGAQDKLPAVDSVDIFNLPPEYKGFVGTLGEMLTVQEDKKSSMLEAKVTMQDPLVSAIIADSLVSKLQKYMTAYRTQKTRHDLEQNIRQNAEAQARYHEAEDRLAEAIDQNRNISSESLRVRIERLRNERNLAFNIYNQTAAQVELTKIKLQEETPIATIVEPAIVPDSAAAPRKMMILVAFTFLGAFLAVGIVVVKSLLVANAAADDDAIVPAK
ncbi:MAG: chain-length determining protein [Rikenellaceae bacterium]|nr:chain-length determining protein [Rikenellaceae bacterium]